MYHNVVETMTAGTSGSDSFTTAINTLNFDMASVHATWSGCDTAVGTLRLRGSNNGTTYTNLDADPVTMTASAGSALWNLWSVPYHYVQLAYGAVSNTTGSIVATAIKKCRR